ncbi:VOC family protein [Rhodococcoides trifolii]|nr:VOC family protein [Rhodococcus trifolii]
MTTTAATGEFTTDGLPHGRTSLTPHIVVARAADAIDFYRDVFGATVHGVTRFGDIVAHAEIEFASGRMTLSDSMESYGLVAPTAGAAVSYSLALYVPDVDDVVTRAADAGATIREPVSTFVSGDRFGSILDPFGVRWSVQTRVDDLSDEESNRRVEEWAATQQG